MKWIRLLADDRTSTMMTIAVSGLAPGAYTVRWTSITWGLQLAAVAGGHVMGAWAGHTVAERRGLPRVRQLPLAIVMVVLTTRTLWSLGQNLVIVED